MCGPCWEGLRENTNGDAEEEENLNAFRPAFCGLSACILQGKDAAQAKTVTRTPNWRHDWDGVRLVEACVHEDVRQIFKDRLRVMSAAQLDSGMSDKSLAHEKAALRFNMKDWHPVNRFANLNVEGCKVDPGTWRQDIDFSKVDDKLRELKKVRSKALQNLERSGKHNDPSPAEIARFCLDKPPNGNIWWDVWYLIMLERSDESLSAVLKTLHDEIPSLARRDSGLGKPEVGSGERRGQGQNQRQKRQREELRCKMADELSHTEVGPDDSVSTVSEVESSVASKLLKQTSEELSGNVRESERQRQQCMLTATIMDLMSKLSDPCMHPTFKDFLWKQLQYNQQKLDVLQQDSPTKRSPPPNPSQEPWQSSSGSQSDRPADASAPSRAT